MCYCAFCIFDTYVFCICDTYVFCNSEFFNKHSFVTPDLLLVLFSVQQFKQLHLFVFAFCDICFALVKYGFCIWVHLVTSDLLLIHFSLQRKSGDLMRNLKGHAPDNNDTNSYTITIIFIRHSVRSSLHTIIWQSIWSKLASWTYSVLRWISKFFLFGALLSDTLKIKHTKNLKEIPSRHVLENLLEKSKHSCL